MSAPDGIYRLGGWLCLVALVCLLLAPILWSGRLLAIAAAFFAAGLVLGITADAIERAERAEREP